MNLNTPASTALQATDAVRERLIAHKRLLISQGPASEMLTRGPRK
jgi:hypothetical protein